MEKLRLKSLHSKGEVLSRAQLKKVLGGTGSGGGSGQCLYCRTNAGDECWYRANPGGNAGDECVKIYPGVGVVTASWGSCESWCKMN